MEFEGEGLDDVLAPLYRALLDKGKPNEGSRGETRELLATSLRILNPRARLSRSEDRGHPFSAVGELLWYLSGQDDLDFIAPYVPAYKDEAVNGKIPGAYGPRLFSMRGKLDQLSNIADMLSRKSSSKRAVVQIFNAEDIAGADVETPCTIALQFHLREGRLHLSAMLRSNDAYLGLPHDIFCFTMLQEMMARRLGVELGEYYHCAGSMHFYDKHIDGANSYLDEGHHKIIAMREMPKGNPFDLVEGLLKTEALARRNEPVSVGNQFAEGYWSDIARLIQIFWASGDSAKLDQLKNELEDSNFASYLEARREMKKKFNVKVVL